LFEELVGQKIMGVTFPNNDTEMVIKTEEWKYHYIAEGDCCAAAYIAEFDFNDLARILGKEVVAVASRGHSETEGWNTVDTEFYTIKTHSGDVEVELRTEHNGYYCGWLKLISTEKIWPVFDDIREEAIKES